MKTDAYLPAAILFLVTINCLRVATAAPLTTVQNSTLSVPTADLVSAGLPGATNLTGSNLLLAAVQPDTLRGGHAFIKNAQQWLRPYGFPTTFQDGAAYAIVSRTDGSIVVSGPSSGPGSATDFATICYTSHGTSLWTNRYDGPSHGSDYAYLLASDSNGNVWVAGSSMRNATNSTLTDVVTLKYASNGVPVWTNRYNSFETNGAGPMMLAVDDVGNAYVSISAAYWVGYSGTPIEHAIIKYDGLGNLVWIKHYFASAPDPGQGLGRIGPMTLDDAGNLLVTGEAGAGGHSLVKFASDGTAVWTNYHSFGFVFGYTLLSVDPQDDIIVTGEDFTSDNSNSYESYVVMKCSKDGGSLWTNVLAGPLYNGGSVPRTLIDPAGNILLIGGTPGTRPGFYRILKIRSTGIPLWTNQNANFGPTNSIIEDAATDNAGNVYLTGFAPAANGERDFVTMKFSGDGQLVWSNRYNGPANREDIAFALAVSDDGGVYVAGRSEGPDGKRDFATIKYADLLFYSPPKDFVGVDTVTCQLTDHLGHSATGTVDILVAPGAFQFGLYPEATRMTPDGMLLQVEGPPGTNAVVLEASPDAVSWLPISTNAPSQGSVQFLDSTAINQSKRFYRVSQEQ